MIITSLIRFRLLITNSARISVFEIQYQPVIKPIAWLSFPLSENISILHQVLGVKQESIILLLDSFGVNAGI